MNKSLNQKFHFQSHLKHLLALLGSFTDLNDRIPYPFIYFNSWNSYLNFIYLKPKKSTFRGEPPRLSRYREYAVPHLSPPPPNAISLYMFHSSSSFYLSRVISVSSKAIQREKWNQALHKRRIELMVSKNQKGDVQSTFNIPLNCRQICINGEGKTSSL